MDIATIITLIIGGVMAGGNVYQARTASRTLAVIERAEQAALHGIAVSRGNTIAIAGVRDQVKTVEDAVNGHTDRLVKAIEVESKANVERAFAAGQESQRSAEPPATAAAVATVQQSVDDVARVVAAAVTPPEALP